MMPAVMHSHHLSVVMARPHTMGFCGEGAKLPKPPAGFLAIMGVVCNQTRARNSHLSKLDAGAGAISGDVGAEPRDIAGVIAFAASPAARGTAGLSFGSMAAG
jgi:hypothetical protein